MKPGLEYVVDLLAHGTIEQPIGADHQGTEVAVSLFAQQVDHLQGHKVGAASHSHVMLEAIAQLLWLSDQSAIMGTGTQAKTRLKFARRKNQKVVDPNLHMVY